MTMCLAVFGITACSSDIGLDGLAGEDTAAHFVWTRAEDVETHAKFLRNFGVGYSYDAVRGSYCDWHDIRSQVVNRHFVENMEEKLFHMSNYRTSSVNQTFEYSKRDYVANVHLEYREEVDLGLYGGTKRTHQNFIEDGVQETYYFMLEERQQLAEHYLSYASLLSSYRKQPDMLTLSFRNAVEHLTQTYEEDIAAVDSFINVWGTHVIVGATLGGSLNIDLMNYAWRWNDEAKIDQWTTEEFLKKKKEKEKHDTQNEYQWLTHARLNITAKGGDQSTLTNLLGEYRPDGSRSFSTDGIAQWRSSLYYDPYDEENSNVELISMRVIPIWEFADVVNNRVALRIKAAIQQDAAMQQQLLGNWNFFDTSFPVRYPTVACQYRNTSGDWQRYERSDDGSMVVNIVSGGRYVATVCHETIEGKDLWVCYPIYEGKVKLACGVGVDVNQFAYNVKWVGGKATVTLTGEMAGDTFYITAGAVRVKPTEGVSYAESEALPYIELAGGIQPDGSYKATAYQVLKQGTDFLLTAQGVDDIVGFTLESDDLYVRNSDYTYIYNPNEIK